MCVSVCVSCRRSVQLGDPTSLTRNLYTSVVPEHSLRQKVMSVCKGLKKMPKQNFSHLPSRGHHLTCQLRETMLMTKLNGLCVFLGFFCVFSCDIKVLNEKYVNNHVIDLYI